MRFTFTIDETMAEKLDRISEEKGLNKSEITRRGLLNELEDLESD